MQHKVSSTMLADMKESAENYLDTNEGELERLEQENRRVLDDYLARLESERGDAKATNLSPNFFLEKNQNSSILNNKVEKVESHGLIYTSGSLRNLNDFQREQHRKEIMLYDNSGEEYNVGYDSLSDKDNGDDHANVVL